MELQFQVILSTTPRYPSISAKAAMMMVAGFYFHPAEKSHFFVIYYRCVTFADGKPPSDEGGGKTKF